MEDIVDLGSIRILVDEFYGQVRLDGLLGPVFAGVIKDDWQPHLDKMYAFWNAALFRVPGFRGNPFARHAPLGIGPNHFERWVELFTATVDRSFRGPVAEDAKNRAGIMARMFMSRLAGLDGNAKKVVV